MFCNIELSELVWFVRDCRNPCFIRLCFAIEDQYQPNGIDLSRNPCFIRLCFAITIYLQRRISDMLRRNPCFIRLCFAMNILDPFHYPSSQSQSLFY